MPLRAKNPATHRLMPVVSVVLPLALLSGLYVSWLLLVVVLAVVLLLALLGS